jgi:hypothetical protein
MDEAGVGGGVFRSDGEHPPGDELLFSSALSGGEATEDGGDHLVMVLEGISIAPRWSAAFGSVVGVVVQLLVLELLSQAKAVLHLMSGILVERTWAIKDLLVLLVIVMLDARFINGGDDVVWSAVAILTRLGSFWPITAAVTMVTTVIVMVVVVALVVGADIIAACWAMSAHILIEAHLGFLSISVLVGGRDHLTNPYVRLAIELGAKLAVMESSDEGGDDLHFHDVWNRIPHLGKASVIATEEIGWLLVNAVEIMLGARPSTRSHIIVGEDFF